jgi:hypothetical protein
MRRTWSRSDIARRSPSYFRAQTVGEIFKLREVYRHLSNSADRADAVGRLIGKIVVKTT